MKHLHRFYYPPAWPITAKLLAAMLLVALIPMSLTAYYNLSWQNSRNVLVGMGAIASIISLLFAQKTLKPIRILTKAAQTIERGDLALGSLVKISRTQDDIGQLVRVFLKIAQEVQVTREQRLTQQVKQVLIQQLSNSDIDWLLAMGRPTEIAAGTVLVREGKTLAFHILLDGILTVTVSQNQTSDWEIARLASGEVVGESFLVSTPAIATTIKAVENSLVLSIPRRQLAEKLQQDVGFAARFYRALATLVSDRLYNLISQFSRRQLVQDQPVRDMLFVLGELNDSDIDWIISAGNRQKVAANTVLIHEGGAVDALYILLNGTMTVSVSENKPNPFTRAFAPRESSETSSLEIARLSRGEIIGETPFIKGGLPFATIKAIEDSLVLSIPRQELAAKLQQDIGFAARFYRAIATLLSSRLQEMLNRLGYIKLVDSKSQSFNGAVESEDELDFRVLDQMAMAGNRFDWMLKRLKVI